MRGIFVLTYDTKNLRLDDGWEMIAHPGFGPIPELDFIILDDVV